MEILLWLLPAAVVTACAMAWAGWAGRERPEQVRSDAQQQRFAAAIMKPLPDGANTRTPPPRERSTGVALRPSERDRAPRRTA